MLITQDYEACSRRSTRCFEERFQFERHFSDVLERMSSDALAKAATVS